MNKSNIRMYPYFFAMNFDKPQADKNWHSLRVDILKAVLQQFGALPGSKTNEK